MLQKLKENSVLFFLVKALILYVLWYVLYELWLHPNGKFDGFVIDNLIRSGEFILTNFGYRLIPEPDITGTIRTLGIDGTHGLWIGDPCNGISLFVLFAGFIIAYPGPFKKKLWFIPLGIISIHLLNIVRIISLVLITYKAPQYLEFNHTYTFTILVYSYVFMLWMLWANKLSVSKTNSIQ